LKFCLLATGTAFLLSFAAACGDDDAGGSRDAESRDVDGADAAESSDDAGNARDAEPSVDAVAARDAAGPGDAQGSDAASASARPVDLGAAADFVILAKSGISTVPTSVVTGSIGVSPAAATSMTGFALAQDATSVFAMSPQVTGKLLAADYAAPTPTNLTSAVGDMLLAFTDAAGRAPDVTELGAGNIGGMTLTPGVYKWATALLIPTDVTLAGSATDVWVFQIAQTLTMGNGAKVLLKGGARSKNVFWQVSGLVELGTTAHCEGIVLSQTSVTLRTGASIDGRLLAQTAVNLDTSTVTAPN
jgi:Ice-binding-like